MHDCDFIAYYRVSPELLLLLRHLILPGTENILFNASISWVNYSGLPLSPKGYSTASDIPFTIFCTKALKRTSMCSVSLQNKSFLHQFSNLRNSLCTYPTNILNQDEWYYPFLS